MYSPEDFERGIAEFNAGRYRECHDAWEMMWHQEEGERHRFLQALIQAAEGAAHAVRGNRAGANNQLSRSLEKLGTVASPFMGVDVDALRGMLTALQEEIGIDGGRSNAPVNAALLPTIHYVRELTSRLGRFRETDE